MRDARRAATRLTAGIGFQLRFHNKNERSFCCSLYKSIDNVTLLCYGFRMVGRGSSPPPCFRHRCNFLHRGSLRNVIPAPQREALRKGGGDPSRPTIEMRATRRASLPIEFQRTLARVPAVLPLDDRRAAPQGDFQVVARG